MKTMTNLRKKSWFLKIVFLLIISFFLYNFSNSPGVLGSEKSSGLAIETTSSLGTTYPQIAAWHESGNFYLRAVYLEEDKHVHLCVFKYPAEKMVKCIYRAPTDSRLKNYGIPSVIFKSIEWKDDKVFLGVSEEGAATIVEVSVKGWSEKRFVEIKGSFGDSKTFEVIAHGVIPAWSSKHKKLFYTGIEEEGAPGIYFIENNKHVSFLVDGYHPYVFGNYLYAGRSWSENNAKSFGLFQINLHTGARQRLLQQNISTPSANHSLVTYIVHKDHRGEGKEFLAVYNKMGKNTRTVFELKNSIDGRIEFARINPVKDAILLTTSLQTKESINEKDYTNLGITRYQFVLLEKQDSGVWGARLKGKTNNNQGL